LNPSSSITVTKDGFELSGFATVSGNVPIAGGDLITGAAAGAQIIISGEAPGSSGIYIMGSADASNNFYLAGGSTKVTLTGTQICNVPAGTYDWDTGKWVKQ
jgi:hypothetical protein